MVSRIHDSTFKEVKWMRASELYKSLKISLWNNGNHYKFKIREGFESFKPLVTVLNSIRFNNSLLEKIFEDQKCSEYGIYYAKINQNGSWKYVNIDDHIPIVKDKKTGKYVHAFF